MRARLSFVAALSSAGLASPGARAGNGAVPRTPVLWEDVACMMLVDRSVEPVLHIPYGIPYEDTDVTVDEAPDSRTHQFLAFCRQHDLYSPLPTWVSTTDVAATAAVGLLEIDDVAAADVFETNETWAGCWFRINADDARRPITFAMADEGVDWDTSVIPAGVYTIEGYTYEPVFNVLFPRPGVVKVHDGDPAAVGPAAAVTSTDQTPYADQIATLEGCVDTLEGSTLAAYWARATEPPIEWTPLLVDEPVLGDSFAVEFGPPAELAGASALIRIDITDPMDRTYSAHMKGRVIVIPGSAECADAGGSFVDEPECDTGAAGSDSTTAVTGSSGAVVGTESGTELESTDAVAEDEESGRGCGCASDASGSGLVGLGLLALGRARRRARSPAQSTSRPR